jgi:hypothetical protein
MSSPYIESFLFDDENEEKIMSHGLSAYRVMQVLGNIHVVLPNKKRRRGTYLIIGRDNGGSCISIPVERTYDPVLWRPITAWPCKAGEETILKKKER